VLSPQAKVEGRKRRRKAHRPQTHTGLNMLAGRWKILVAWERKYVSLFSVGEWPVEGGGLLRMSKEFRFALRGRVSGSFESRRLR